MSFTVSTASESFSRAGHWFNKSRISRQAAAIECYLLVHYCYMTLRMYKSFTSFMLLDFLPLGITATMFGG
jgi:hypothetical protein